jgi:hypothetical protein
MGHLTILLGGEFLLDVRIWEIENKFVIGKEN